jgi:small-conductance mechanosensitive channel
VRKRTPTNEVELWPAVEFRAVGEGKRASFPRVQRPAMYSCYRMTSVLCDADRRRDIEELRVLFVRLAVVLALVGILDIGVSVFQVAVADNSEWFWWLVLGLASILVATYAFCISLRDQPDRWISQGRRREIAVALFPLFLCTRYAVWIRTMTLVYDMLLRGAIFGRILIVLESLLMLVVFVMFLVLSFLYYRALGRGRSSGSSGSSVGYTRLGQGSETQNLVDDDEPTPVRIDSL